MRGVASCGRMLERNFMPSFSGGVKGDGLVRAHREMCGHAQTHAQARGFIHVQKHTRKHTHTRIHSHDTEAYKQLHMDTNTDIHTWNISTSQTSRCPPALHKFGFRKSSAARPFLLPTAGLPPSEAIRLAGDSKPAQMLWNTKRLGGSQEAGLMSH